MRRSTRVRYGGGTWELAATLIVLGLAFRSAQSSPINRQVGISENVFITVQNDTYGNEQRVCSIDSVTYEDGDSIPTSSPCEHCICRPPGFACTIISCEYRPGCKALKRSNQCCPEYQCECEKDGKIYQNGEKILDNNNPCEVCYCQGGDVICAVIDCYWRSDCQPRYIENRCCPLYDHCPPPSHPGPHRPIQTLPTTTRRPTTLASVFPWANTTTTTVAPSVPAELSTTTPLASLSTSTQNVASSVVPSEPTQENLVIPSQSQYQGAASPVELSTNAPDASSAKVSTPISSVTTASTSAVSQSSESPTQGQEPLSHVLGETEPDVQNLPPQNPEAATETPVVINVNLQGAAELGTSEAISPQSSVSEQTVDISPTTSSVSPIEPTPVQEIQAIQSAQIVQEQPPVAPGQEVSPAEATVVAHDTEEIATAEPTKILETVEEAGPSSTTAHAPVDPSAESSAAINPSVIATSVLDPAVEPTILPTTISTVSQSDGLTSEIYDEKPVEPQTERPVPIEINSSAKPIQSVAQENAFPEPEKEEPIVVTTAQPASQDAPLASEPVNELVETQNNEISVNDPNAQSTNLPVPSKESKPFVQHDIIIDPVEQNNELPAILAQQRPAESAEKDETSLAAHLSHQNAPASVSQNDTAVIPQSIPVASGAVIQLLPGPTDIPAANLDETGQVQTSSPAPSHDGPSIENNVVEYVQNGPIEQDLVETTSGLPFAQNDHSNVSGADVASDDKVEATTIPSSSSVADEALSDDVNTPVGATEKTPEKLVDAPELPSIMSINHETLFGDDILTTNSFPERTTEIYHDEAPVPEKASGTVESQTAPPALSSENDESVVTTVPSVVRDAPVVGEDKNVENLTENNNIVPEISEATSSSVLSDSASNGDELSGDEGSGEKPEINNVVPISDDKVISIVHSSNNNDEPVATTSYSVASDDVEINEEVNELLTTTKSVAVEQDAGQQDAENDEAVAAATTREPAVEISQVGDHQQEEQVVTEPQLGQDTPSSLSTTLKLRLDPSVFTSGESSSNEQHDGANKNIVNGFEPIATTTHPIALNSDDEIPTTQTPAVAISRQEDITNEPAAVTTESDVVFDIVGATSSSAPGAPNELKSESIVEDSITTTEPSVLLNGDELRSHLTQYDDAIPTEQNIELTTTTAGIISRERSDLDSVETINDETSTLPQQVRTKVTDVVGSSINNESESESATVELDLLNDEKVEGDDAVSTTPQATLLLRHHHPDHHGFLIEETTRLPKQQEEEQQRQVEGNESTKEDDNRETLFRTFEVTTVLSEPEADEPASETTLSSKPDFRSDLDFDIITSSQSSALPGDGESNDPVNAASLSESQSNPNPSTESSNTADEPAQTTVLPALLEDDQDDATTVVVSIVEDDSTNIPERSRGSIPKDFPVPTTTASPIELEDALESETTVSSLDDIDDVVGTTTVLTALDEAENDTDATSPTASAVVDNRVPPELARKPSPIVDDLPANGVGRSDLSLQGQLKDEVNSPDDTWFWRTVNRVRRLPDFFSVLSRKPRSTSSKPELQKPAKAKKATQFERKPIIRPFLFW